MKTEYKALGGFGTLGIEIVLCILVGVVGGRWIDGKLGTDPGFTIFGFVCGLGAAGKAVFRTMKEMKAVTEREEREQGNPAPQFAWPEKRDKAAKDERDDEPGDDERAQRERGKDDDERA